MLDNSWGLKLSGFLRRNADLLACILSGIIVSAWTLLRFFTQPSTYDLVTQQAVAINWSQGNFGYVIFGPTHYLLKIFVLYIPVELLPGSPRLKLILLTILVNIATIVLTFILLKKILRQLGLKTDKYLALAILWLATIAGSVFWIQYANSRNLEIVGGLLMVYLGLRFLRQPTKSITTGLIIVASLLFFSDKLQIYMTAVPLLVYAAIIHRKKLSDSRVLPLAGLILAGIAISLVLLQATVHLLDIKFTTSDSLVVHYSLSEIPRAVALSVKNMLISFSGDSDATAGRARQIFNLIFFATSALIFIWAALKRLLPNKLVIFVAVYFVCNELVYLISGQAIISGTGRYLIMLSPVALIGVTAVLKLVKTSRAFIIGFVLLIIFNCLSLCVVLAQSWDTNFPKDAHLQSIARYAEKNNVKVVYGSMSSLLPSMYYRITPSQTNLVALACVQPNVILAHSVPNPQNQILDNGKSAIILDNTVISNFPSVCTKDMIISQLGQPYATDKIDDGSQVLLYDNQVFKKLN